MCITVKRAIHSGTYVLKNKIMRLIRHCTFSMAEEGVCADASGGVPHSEAVVPGARESCLPTQAQDLHLLRVSCQCVPQFAGVNVPYSNTAAGRERERGGGGREGRGGGGGGVSFNSRLMSHWE